MRRALLFCLFAIFISSCSEPQKKVASGYTQGTTYSVAYYSEDLNVQYQIDSLLLNFDRVLSTYQESSYISKWNRNEAEESDQPRLFKEVVKRSIEIHAMSSGVFDITVSPLMKYWFENNWEATDPDSSAVDSLMGLVGMNFVAMQDGDYTKSNPLIQLDVNAIAQGYSVDVLARYLESRGIFSYLVEVGGEVRAGAPKPNGDLWAIGVDKPVDANLSRNLALPVGLEKKSLATSGNYRKFVEVNGQKLGHTLDPTSGYPATTDVLSSTVIADDCMTADALATACMALGFEKAKSLIETEERVEGIFIYSDGEEIKTWVSPGAEGWILKVIKE